MLEVLFCKLARVHRFTIYMIDPFKFMLVIDLSESLYKDSYRVTRLWLL